MTDPETIARLRARVAELEQERDAERAACTANIRHLLDADEVVGRLRVALAAMTEARDLYKRDMGAALAALGEERREVERLRQAHWDGRAIGGFDNDGDPTPRSVASDFAALIRDDWKRARAEADEADSEVERLTAARLNAEMAVCDANERGARDAQTAHALGFAAGIEAAVRAVRETVRGWEGDVVSAARALAPERAERKEEP